LAHTGVAKARVTARQARERIIAESTPTLTVRSQLRHPRVAQQPEDPAAYGEDRGRPSRKSKRWVPGSSCARPRMTVLGERQQRVSAGPLGHR
jgi:hypothetical protein